MADLGIAEQSAVDQYQHDMDGMDLKELSEELVIVSTLIDDETSWQEALTARIKQLS